MTDWRDEEFLITDFAITYELASADVRNMLRLGLVETVEALAGRALMFAEGLTVNDAKRAYQALQRMKVDQCDA